MESKDISDIINQEPSEEDKQVMQLMAYMLVNVEDLESLGTKDVFQENKRELLDMYSKVKLLPNYNEYFSGALEFVLDMTLREDPNPDKRLERNIPIFLSWYSAAQNKDNTHD